MPRRLAVAATPASVTRCTGTAVAAEGRIWRECAQHALEEGSCHGGSSHDQDGQDQAQSALLQRHAVDALGGRATELAHPEGGGHCQHHLQYNGTHHDTQGKREERKSAVTGKGVKVADNNGGG